MSVSCPSGFLRRVSKRRLDRGEQESGARPGCTCCGLERERRGVAPWLLSERHAFQWPVMQRPQRGQRHFPESAGAIGGIHARPNAQGPKNENVALQQASLWWSSCICRRKANILDCWGVIGNSGDRTMRAQQAAMVRACSLIAFLLSGQPTAFGRQPDLRPECAANAMRELSPRAARCARNSSKDKGGGILDCRR